MNAHNVPEPQLSDPTRVAESVAEREALRERLGERWDWLLANTCSPYHSGWMDALEWVRELLNDGRDGAA